MPLCEFSHVPGSNPQQDLLKDITKNGDDPAAKTDLTSGIDAAERILKKANEAVERNVLDEALEELIGRVEDWKNHRVEQFGRLLQHGIYTVITGRSDQEKDVSSDPLHSILSVSKPGLTVI